MQMNLENALGENCPSKYNKNMEWLGEMSKHLFSVVGIFHQMGDLSFGPPCHTTPATQNMYPIQLYMISASSVCAVHTY